jgi:cell fate (sporulation/competence/biofilm development) regulator YlbF (YheA/YmcA/DUF963 family)
MNLWFDTSSVVTAILAVVQLIVTSALVVYTVRIQRKIQAADTSIRCQERYEQLLDTRDSITTFEQADRYFDRFWGAQLDQFIHWRNGLIPDETYAEWIAARRHQARKDATLADISFRTSWTTRYETRFRNSDFGEFMNAALLEGNLDDALADRTHVRKKLSKYRRAWG